MIEQAKKQSFTIGLAMVVALLSCYLGTMFSLVHFTHSGWSSGQWGGGFTFVPFGVSTVFHLESGSLRPIFHIPDFVSYLLVVIVLFNLLGLFSKRLSWSETRLHFANIVIAALCLSVYMLTMMFVEDALEYMRSSMPGHVAGAVFFYPFFFVGAQQVFEGVFETEEWFAPEITTLLIAWLIVVAVLGIKLQRRKRRCYETTTTPIARNAL